MSQRPSPGDIEGPAERALLERRVLELWEMVNAARRFAAFAEQVGPSKATISSVSLDRLRRWIVVFAEEISVLGRARNSVAHANALPRSDLRSAIRIGERLVELLPDEVRSRVEGAKGAKALLEHEYLGALHRLAKAQERVRELFPDSGPISTDSSEETFTRQQVEALLEANRATEEYVAKRDAFFAASTLEF